MATALSISSLFGLHGDVHCHYVGMNASAATVAAMGAKRITIDADALFLVHKCMNFVFEWDWMNSDELEAHIGELQKMQKDQQTIDGCIAGMYARRCKKPKDELLGLMKEGAWLTARQALEWGFVDEITNDAEDTKPEMTDTVASYLAEAGIPAPPVAARKDSLMDKLRRFFTTEHKPAPDGGAPTGAQDTNDMNKEKTQQPQAPSGQQTAEAEAHAAALAEKDARIAELEAQVADLKKEPAAATATVTETAAPEADADKLAEALMAMLQ